MITTGWRVLVEGRSKGMPTFLYNPNGEIKSRKLTHEELIGAVRYTIAAEFEAIEVYMQLAESTDNEMVKRVMRSVADEERAHVNEFLKILDEIDPRDETLFAEKPILLEDKILDFSLVAYS